MHYYLMGKARNISDCLIPDYCGYHSTEDIIISSGQNITWNSSKNLWGNIIIQNNGTLNINCELSLPADGKIIVNYGGKLIIDHGDLDNLCDENSWRGIEVNDGGYLELISTTIPDYKIDVKSGGTLRIRDELTINGSGRINIEGGGYICIDNTANITLTDALNVINLKYYYHPGVNLEVIPDPGTCVSNPATFSFTGNGSINSNFNTDTYVQNITINSDRYYTGYNIYVGGNVIINNNAKVIFNASNSVYFEGDFNVESGSGYEVE
jgi:hypothetical protein